jgi:RNA polymerase sigma factor (sigma-70 family)
MDEISRFCQQEYPRLTRFLDLYCGDLGVAEELAQEALATAWKNWRKVSAYDNPSAWAHRVAINLANSHFRRRLAERRANERVGLEGTSSPSSDTSDAVALREAVSSLPRRMRSCLLLRYYLDLPFPEIGSVLEMPEATARSLVHRGLKRLKQDPAVRSFREVFDV